MYPISVVIIAKNEQHNIASCIESAKQITNDIIVVDTGSEDQTVSIAIKNGVKVVIQSWNGYGKARNKGAAEANYDWIFSLDADERISGTLVHGLALFDLTNEHHVAKVRRRVYYSGKRLQYGTPSSDKVIRLYNRKVYHWDNAPVHENLISPAKEFILRIGGFLDHYGIRDNRSHEVKYRKYAALGAIKYFQAGIRVTAIRKYLASSFAFLKSFILFFGFLDGREGFFWAWTFAHYTWLKYKHLEQMHVEDQLLPAITYE